MRRPDTPIQTGGIGGSWSCSDLPGNWRRRTGERHAGIEITNALVAGLLSSVPVSLSRVSLTSLQLTGTVCLASFVPTRKALAVTPTVTPGQVPNANCKVGWLDACEVHDRTWLPDQARSCAGPCLARRRRCCSSGAYPARSCIRDRRADRTWPPHSSTASALSRPNISDRQNLSDLVPRRRLLANGHLGFVSRH